MSEINWSSWKQEDLLANGIKIWYRNVPSQTSVFYAFIDAGSRFDGQYPGMAHFTEHMLFQGTTNMPGDEVKRIAAKNGIQINASTCKEFISVETSSILSDNLPVAMDIIFELLAAPLFEEENFNREKGVVLAEIRDKEDRSLSKAMEIAGGVLCPPPYDMPTLGFYQDITDLKVESMKQFHAERFVPRHVTLCYAGPLDKKQVVEQCNAKFGKWATESSGTEPVESDRKYPETALAVRRPDQQQVAVVLAFPGMATEDVDSVKMRLLLDVIGGSWMVSRMFTILRDKLGLCYRCGAGITSFYKQKGVIAFYGTTKPEHVQAFSDGILSILKGIQADAPVTENEFNAAKLKLKAEMLAEVDDLSSCFELFAYLWLAHGTREFGKDLKLIRETTIEEMSELAKKFLSSEPVRIMVGNIETEEPKAEEEPTVTESAEAMNDDQAPPAMSAPVIDRPSPAGSHATRPNSVMPPYCAPGAKKETGSEQEPPASKNQERVTSEADGILDEPTTIRRGKKACSVCGEEFEFLDGVSVSKCPECKLKDIEGMHSVEKVSIHYKNKIGESLQAATAGTKSPGRDYGMRSGSKLKPVSRPAPNNYGGKKGSGGGGGDAGGGEETSKPARGEVHEPLKPETPEEEDAAQAAIEHVRSGGAWESQPRDPNGQWS